MLSRYIGASMSHYVGYSMSHCILVTTCYMSQVDPGEEVECEALRVGRGAGAGCDQCPGQCSAEGVECHEVSRSWSKY